MMRMGKNRITLNICGIDYYITTEDAPEYVKLLGKELDEGMRRLTAGNPRLSVTQVAVLKALETLDDYHKAVESADNLRSKIREYLEDAAKARSETEVFRREIERLHAEVRNLREALGDTE